MNFPGNPCETAKFLSKKSILPLLAVLLLMPELAQAEAMMQSPTNAQERERIERQLQELQSMKKELQRQLGDFDVRMRALEAELNAQAKPEVTPQSAAAPNVPPTAPSPTQAASEEGPKFLNERGLWGAYEPGKGLVAVRAPLGEVDFSFLGYFRYLNQLACDSTWTDAFGRTRDFDRRQDFQVNRFMLSFRGWLFDERFGYNAWAWTQNTAAGDETQVNIGANAWYTFYDWLKLRAGFFSLPTTRSTSQTFPVWLKIDHRTMSDEYFRGSYSAAIMAEGKIAPGVQYKAALANHLSALGVSAAQLDSHLDTLATGLWWMPTTKEFGPAMGFGDYEVHTNLATIFGVHYNRSREDRQSQPSTDGFENTQLFLSDGTLIFSKDPFGTGGSINNLTYQMVALEAGMKLKGWSLEGEYYLRWLNDFDTTGRIPVGDIFDHGFQVQASTMLIPKVLQTYVTGAQVFGDYGDPWEVSLGLTYYPFNRREMRLNFQALYESHAPAGNTALPFAPGARGWIFTLDAGVWF